jgi:hypothetical protein
MEAREWHVMRKEMDTTMVSGIAILFSFFLIENK